MNWAKILADAGIPEPPGREDVLAKIEAKPYARGKKKPKAKAKGKKR